MPLSSHALTTVATVKEYLQRDVNDTSDENLITRLINVASERIEKHCDRHFEQATYTEKYRGNNRQLLRLNQYPVTAVASVTVSESAVDSGDYEILTEEGMLYNENLWTWSGYQAGLVGEDVGSKRNIEVQYTAGYVLPKDETDGPPAVVRTLPYDLEQACIMLVAYYIKTDIDHYSTVFAESGNAISRPTKMPPHVVELLKPYRRLSV